MHLNSDFSAVLVIWTLTFAALLVLLVVLMGRDRARRFPWFTSSIVLVTLDMLGKRLLHGRLSQITLAAIFITLADLVVIVGLMVLLEMARHAFGKVRTTVWIVGNLVMVAVGGVVLAAWGPWPAWKTLTVDSPLAVLGMMQLAEIKGDLLVNVLTVELGLLVVLFGRRFHAGWRSHTQQIMIGLSTVAIAQLALQGVQQVFIATVVINSQADVDRARGFLRNISNANGVVYLAVLLWWIVCLWNDEPAAADTPAEIPAETGVVEAAAETAGGAMEEEQESEL
jgi:hypothetical protein